MNFHPAIQSFDLHPISPLEPVFFILFLVSLNLFGVNMLLRQLRLIFFNILTTALHGFAILSLDYSYKTKRTLSSFLWSTCYSWCLLFTSKTNLILTHTDIEINLPDSCSLIATYLSLLRQLKMYEKYNLYYQF